MKHLSMESSSRVCVPEQWKGAVPSCQSGHLTPPGPEEPGCAGTTCPSAGVGGSFTRVRVSSTHLRAALLKQLSSPPPLLLSVSAPVRPSVRPSRLRLGLLPRAREGDGAERHRSHCYLVRCGRQALRQPLRAGGGLLWGLLSR